MIGKLADYKYTTPTADIDYTLPIMPQRAGDAKNRIYGVDVAFLLEACAERNMICYNWYDVSGLSNESLRAGYSVDGEGYANFEEDAVGQIGNCIYDIYEDFIKAPPTAQTFATKAEVDGTHLTAADIKWSDLQPIYVDAILNNHLRADSLMGCFYAVSKMNTLRADYYSKIFNPSYSSDETGESVFIGDGSQEPSVETRLYQIPPHRNELYKYCYKANHLYPTSFRHSYSWSRSEYVITSGDAAIRFTGFSTYDDPNRVKIRSAVVYAGVRVKDVIGETTTTNSFYERVGSFNADENNLITIPLSNLTQLIAKARSLCSWSTDEPKGATGGQWTFSHDVTVELFDAVAFATLSGHTDISHLDCSWSPSAQGV